MIIRRWQAKTTGEDVKAVLKRFGGLQACDSDSDIVDIVAVCAWYNDRSDENVEAIRRGLAELLEKHGPDRRIK